MKHKIIVVGPLPPPIGGIARYVENIINSKNINNLYDLKIFNTSIPESVRRFNKRNERNYISFLSDGWVAGFKILIYVLKTFFSFGIYIHTQKPKLIHLFTNSYWGFWRSAIYLLIARIFGRKIIFHLLNAIDLFWYESGPFSRSMIKYLLNKSNLLIVQSNGIKLFLKSISNTPCSVIYNGVSNNILPKQTDINDKVINITFIGSLTKNKGVFDIINVASRFKTKKYKFLFIGPGPKKEFEIYAKKIDVHNNVEFLGTVTEEKKIDTLKNSHIFLLPSYAEGQPVAILEGMAAGLPIISTNIGSIPEIVNNNINGFIIKPGDLDQLAKNIDYLISDHDLYNRISKKNLNDIQKLYNSERVIKQIKNNYELIII